MDNIVYIIRDTDLNFTVNVCKTFGKVMEKVMETMHNYGYTSFNLADTVNVYFITFPHADPRCVGHWRIEKWEIED